MLKPVVVRNRREPGTRRFRGRGRPTTPEARRALLLELLRGFVKREGHARVPTKHREGNFHLGRWVGRERALYHAGALSPERIRFFERLPGWTWDAIEYDFQKAVALLRDFARRHGHVSVPRNRRIQGVGLQAWVVYHRHCYRLGRLPKHRREALEAIPEWTRKRTRTRNARTRFAREISFRHGLRLLASFFEAHGHLQPPRGRENGLDLRPWMRRQRFVYRQGGLSREQVRALEAFPGWTWSVRETEFQRGYAVARRYARLHGHTRVPVPHVQDGFRLGRWVGYRRGLYRRGRMDAKMARMLEALPGWTWAADAHAHAHFHSDAYAAAFAEGLGRLRAFARREGHFRVPVPHREGGLALSQWVRVVRRSYRKRILAPERIRALEAVRGWTWSPRRERFGRGLELLALFVKRHGHARVPMRFRPQGFALAAWLYNQRRQYLKGGLSTERRRSLDAVAGRSWRTA